MGLYGQGLAENLLNQNGLITLRQNFRTRLGEIDLIMQDATTLVFVEVKTRRSEKKGSPLEAVSTLKQQQIGKMARIFLQECHPRFHTIRFDVVGVLLTRPLRIQWIKRAFAADS